MNNNSSRVQEFNHTHWREIPEMFVKLFALLFATIALKNTDGGEAFFRENHSVIMAFVLAIVVYFLASMLLVMLQFQIRNCLPMLIMLVLGSFTSVLAVAIISFSVALITLALCLSVFALVAYSNKGEVYKLVSSAVRDTIRNWIGRDENLPISTEAPSRHYQGH